MVRCHSTAKFMVRKLYSDHTICTALDQDCSTGRQQRGSFFFPGLISFSAAALILTPGVDSLSLRVSWHYNLFASDYVLSVSGKQGWGELRALLACWMGEGITLYPMGSCWKALFSGCCVTKQGHARYLPLEMSWGLMNCPSDSLTPELCNF